VSAEVELLQSVTVVAVVRPLLVQRRLPEVRDSLLQTLLGVAADLRCRHHHLLPEARLPEGVRRWQVLSEGRLLERMRLYEEAARARGCRHRRLPKARLLLRILRVLRMPLLEEAAERSCRL
jgi:hypothetical protein